MGVVVAGEREEGGEEGEEGGGVSMAWRTVCGLWGRGKGDEG